jgi:hypothetical protein
MIKPDLQFSIVCDDVRREENGKFILIGLFGLIGAVQFPAVHPVVFVVNRWCKGEGEFSQRTRILSAADNEVIAESPTASFRLADLDGQHTIISRFVNVRFPAPGKYWVEVLLGDELIRNYPIVLVEQDRRFQA